MHDALCDSFDTETALNALAELVVATNSYMAQQGGEEVRKVALVRSVSRFIFKILKVFGVYVDDDMPNLIGGEEGGVNVE